MADKIKVLVTGGSGQLGQMIARHCAARYALRLAYHSRPIAAPAGGEVVQLDLTDYASTLRAMQGVEAVVHLGADAGQAAGWESILPNNLVGTYHAYEAAREAGVRRLIFASSNHAAGYAIIQDRTIGPDAPIQPDSLYGVSKVYGEALGRYYHDEYGLEVICLRIGSCHEAEDEAAQRARVARVAGAAGRIAFYTPRQLLSIYLHPLDFCQLIERSLEADCGYGIFYGASANTPAAFDLSETRRVLGYDPQYNVQDFTDVNIAALA